MKRLWVIFWGVTLYLSILIGIASAATAYTTGNVNMRRGPGVQFAVITTIPSGVAVSVYECVGNGRWCVVQWRHFEGYVSARYLTGFSTGYVVPPAIAVYPPLIYFGIGNYYPHYKRYVNPPRYRPNERPRIVAPPVPPRVGRTIPTPGAGPKGPTRLPLPRFSGSPRRIMPPSFR